MSSTFGQLYQCHYEAVVGSDSRSLEEENVAKADVVDLLKPMETAPCLVQVSGLHVADHINFQPISNFFFLHKAI